MGQSEVAPQNELVITTSGVVIPPTSGRYVMKVLPGLFDEAAYQGMLGRPNPFYGRLDTPTGAPVRVDEDMVQQRFRPALSHAIRQAAELAQVRRITFLIPENVPEGYRDLVCQLQEEGRNAVLHTLQEETSVPADITAGCIDERIRVIGDTPGHADLTKPAAFTSLAFQSALEGTPYWSLPYLAAAQLFLMEEQGHTLTHLTNHGGPGEGDCAGFGAIGRHSDFKPNANIMHKVDTMRWTGDLLRRRFPHVATDALRVSLHSFQGELWDVFDEGRVRDLTARHYAHAARDAQPSGEEVSPF